MLVLDWKALICYAELTITFRETQIILENLQNLLPHPLAMHPLARKGSLTPLREHSPPPPVRGIIRNMWRAKRNAQNKGIACINCP